MKKRYFIAFKILILVVPLGVTIVGPHFPIIFTAFQKLEKESSNYAIYV